MELNATLISLQGALVSTCKSTDDFTKIKYKGGNEMKISTVVNAIKQFLIREKCLIEDNINSGKENTVREIVFFLALNCEYKEELIMKDYEHLIGVNFKLSKCLFANVITELKLINTFAAVLHKFPLTVQTEILEELIPCLKKADVSLNLYFVADILTAVITEVNEIVAEERKIKEEIENLLYTSEEILNVLRGLDLEQTKLWKSSSIYRQMGYKLLTLLQLLLLCDHTKDQFIPLIKNISYICSDIIAAITVDVFCEWAEVQEKGEPLQTAVASAAYYTLQKYAGYEPAKQLSQRLNVIASKPKTVCELIQQADTSKMIEMVELGDKNQKQWFQALLRTQVLSDVKALICIEKYYQLCGETDVERILNLCGGKEVVQRKLDLVLKCVSILPLEQSVILVTRYFRRYGIQTALNGQYNKEKLVFLLNKMEEKEEKAGLVKGILLLLLQNLKEVLLDLFCECLKNAVYSACLKEVFRPLKEVVVIDDVCIITLKSLITDDVLLENHEQLAALLKVLLETECVAYNDAIRNLLLPLLCKLSADGNVSCLSVVMQVLNAIYVVRKIKNPELVISEIFKILVEHRCNFLDFDQRKQDVVRECIVFLNNCEHCDVIPVENYEVGTLDYYYMKTIWYQSEEPLFNYLFPDYQTEDYYKSVCRLVKVLPSCVTEEWKDITSILESKSGTEIASKILTDALILICSATTKDNPTLETALKYCLNNYMISVKGLHQSTLENQVVVARNACRLLQAIPLKSIEEDGLVMVGLMSELALKQLSREREFICSILSIHNKNIAELLSQKITK